MYGRNGKNKDYKEKICYICGETFKPNCGVQKLCSNECRAAARRRRSREEFGWSNRENLEPKTCVICGEQYKPKAKSQKTCSKECGYELTKKNQRERMRRKKTTPSEEIGIRHDIPWNMDYDPWDTYAAPVEMTQTQLHPLG